MNFSRIITTIIMVCATSHVIAQDLPSKDAKYSEVYDLRFKCYKTDDQSLAIRPWIDNDIYADERRLHSFVGGRLPSPRTTYNPLLVELMQRIPLPENINQENNDDIEDKNNAILTLYSSGFNIKKGKMTVRCLNNREEVIGIDSVKIATQKIFGISVLKIPLLGAAMLDINIRAEGLPNSQAHLLIDKLEIELNHESIDQYEIPSLPPYLPKGKPKYFEVDTSNKHTLDRIEAIGHGKIIGIAESLSYSPDIEKLSHELIKKMIETQNCRLVLLDVRFDHRHMYNRYVREPNFRFPFDFYYEETDKDLLDWIKQYNTLRQPSNQVSVFGIQPSILLQTNLGYNTISTQSVIEELAKEFDYYELRVINNIAQKIDEKDQRSCQQWKDLLDMIDSASKQMLEYMPEYIYKTLRQSVWLNANTPKDLPWLDSHYRIENELVKFLIENFASDDKKVVINAHAEKLNKISSYPTSEHNPLGSFLQKTYGDQYRAFNILQFNGHYTDKYRNYNYEMTSAPKGSIEHYLAKSRYKLLYLPVDESLDRQILVRSNGSLHYNREFYPMNLYRRFDGLFFINQVNIDPKNIIERSK